jgi:hypothetical protein
LADEDTQQDPDRWCSHSAWGQECWQLIAQWVWNLRLELGHQLEPTSLRTTEFAAAISPSEPTATCPASSVPSCGYGPPTTATSWKAGRFTGADFPLQPDGTLRCPAGQVLTAHEQRREVDGSLRVVYGASIRSCRPCPLREQCQWQGSATKKPRQVSMLLHPLTVGPAPLLWRDWSRRLHRRACMHEARVPSASRYRKNPGVLPAHLSCRCPSPEPSEHIPVSAGKNASLAMCALKRRTR